MAADIKLYEDSNGLPIKARKITGVDSIEIVAEIDTTSGEGAGSIYRIAQIPANYIPVWGEINCEAVTSMNDNDLGLYETDEHGGGVLDKDIFVDGADHSSALAIGSGTNAIKDLTTLNLGKTLNELVSNADGVRQAYTLALTANAGPAATKKIFLRMRFINGN